MTVTRLERLTREALGSASSAADTQSGFVVPAMVAIGVTALLLLSGCAMNPVQPPPPAELTLNLGEATSWLGQAQATGGSSLAGR